MAEKPVEDALDDWLGLSDPPKSKEKVKSGGKLDVKEAVAFMEKGAMSEAQLALGLLTITAHAKALLDGGLTRDALLILIQSRLPNMSNGKKPSLTLIESVLRGASELSLYVDPAALERVRAARSKR